MHSNRSARPRNRKPKLSRVMFYVHLWVGVTFTVVILVISVTGIILNHKVALGYMPEVEHEAQAPFESALPLSQLASIGLTAAADSGLDGDHSIDRMDVRPRNGFVKIRLRDPASTEVTVDLSSGAVLNVGARGDVFLERLHSGEILGSGWVLLSDAASIALLVTILTGYWLWLGPKLSRGIREQLRDAENTIDGSYQETGP